MTCREASNLLPLFFDGELDPHQMRMVALHSTRCDGCEAALRRMERVQELVSTTVAGAVDEINLAAFFTGVEARLGTVRTSWWKRMWERTNDRAFSWPRLVPAFAAAAAVAILALVFFMRTQQPTVQPAAPQVATIDNAMSIDSLESDVDSVAVLNDPQTSTTALWVSDDGQTSGDTP